MHERCFLLNMKFVDKRHHHSLIRYVTHSLSLQCAVLGIKYIGDNLHFDLCDPTQMKAFSHDDFMFTLNGSR